MPVRFQMARTRQTSQQGNEESSAAHELDVTVGIADVRVWPVANDCMLAAMRHDVNNVRATG